MDITAVNAAMSSLKAAADIAQAMVGLGVSQAVQAKVWEMHGKMIETQQAIFTIQQERAALVDLVAELKRQIGAHETWDQEKARYQLAEIRPGLFCYRLKMAAADMEPAHDLCARCFEERKKSILQGERRKFAGFETLRCGICASELRYFRSDLPHAPRVPLRSQQ